MLGANGVGKSTLLKTIYGFLPPASGDVWLDGKNLTGVPTHQRIRLGLAYITQQPSIFPWMNVEENLEIGAWTFRRDKARITAQDRGKLRAFSGAEGSSQVQGWYAVWRTTAHGGTGAHPDDRTQGDPGG